jgi:hypothetical protein
VAVLSVQMFFWSAFVALAIKWLLHLVVMRSATRLMKEQDLFLFSLLGDVFSPFFNAMASISVVFKSPTSWK